MIVVLGSGRDRFYTYRVHVNGTDPRDDDELDVNAPNERDALKLATADANELYIDYTLTLISVV